jgi:hypothetical protein
MNDAAQAKPQVIASTPAGWCDAATGVCQVPGTPADTTAPPGVPGPPGDTTTPAGPAGETEM